MMKKYKGVIIWTLVAIIITAFIFTNSIASKNVSSGFSENVAEILYGIIGPFVELTFDAFHGLVRKAAHFVEFAVLGSSLWMITWSARETSSKLNTSTAFLVALTVAVADEFIQSFTGRGSAVADVVLDYCGAVCGILIAMGIALIKQRNRAT